MISPEYVQLLATYNQWMNLKLYELCANMSDEERKEDRRAFFKSIHGTLNHIMLADKVWFGRFEGKPFLAKSLDQELYADFGELRRERELMDKRIINWAQNISAAELKGELSYTSILGSGTKSLKLWMAVTHFFNHQTHHRGHVTTLIRQIGPDPGVTDLIAMPGIIT